jgi:hypothetical protein
MSSALRFTVADVPLLVLCGAAAGLTGYFGYRNFQPKDCLYMPVIHTKPQAMHYNFDNNGKLLKGAHFIEKK